MERLVHAYGTSPLREMAVPLFYHKEKAARVRSQAAFGLAIAEATPVIVIDGAQSIPLYQKNPPHWSLPFGRGLAGVLIILYHH